MPADAHRGLVFNLQRTSVGDGPGVRTTVFLKGCPLACAWCHNPEGRAPRPEIVVMESRCIACGLCVSACPLELAGPVDRGLRAAEVAACNACGACVDACPAEARQLAGEEWTVEELVAALLRDRPFFAESGGGVTFSGGEPLSQAPFLRQALAALRAEGVHTAVDTCGLAPATELAAVAELADLFLFDLKLMDETRHRRWTGVSNAPILANLERLGAGPVPVWLRVPLVPGVNDDEENLAATARLAARLPAVEKLCLLPYHRLGEDKLRRLARKERRQLTKVKPPTDERMAQLASAITSHGVSAQVGG
jgi:pyruvate formate lyase activating enzyme